MPNSATAMHPSLTAFGRHEGLTTKIYVSIENTKLGMLTNCAGYCCTVPFLFVTTHVQVIANFTELYPSLKNL